MYVEQPFRISNETLARLVTLCTRLDLAPGPGGSRMAADCREVFAPELSAVIPGGWTYATVVALYPSGQLVAHCDAPAKGTRYHVPLVLNDRCWVFHDGCWQQLTEGQGYTMDPTQLHGAVNWGPTVRLHLLIDTQTH